jgi:hypothetical protein
MSELGRIKDEDGLAGDLLRAADDDAPPASSRRAIGAAIGLAPSIGHGAGAVHAAKASAVAKLGGGIALKVTAVVAVVGTAVGVHHVATRAPASPPPPAIVASRAPAQIAMPTPAPIAIAPPPAPPPSAIVPPPAPVEAPPAPRPPPPAHRATVPAPPPPIETAPPPPAAETGPAPPVPAAPSLGDEIAQLELALAAVRRHDPSAALAALDAYDRRFPAGKLAPEALAARVEATLAAGDRAGGRTLAARFLAEHPKSPLAQHVRDLVEAR